MSFLNLRISGRLYAGFGALVLFCAGLAGFAVWQLGEIHTQVATMTLQSNNTIRAGEIATELQAVRRAILRYAFDQDEESYAEAGTRLNKSADLVEAAVKETRAEERRTAYRGIAKDVEDLKAKRNDLGETMKQMVAGRAQLFSDGDKLAADVQKFVKAAEGTEFSQEAAPLEAKVLLLQVTTWRMLTTRDPNGVATFKANLGKALDHIEALENADLPPKLAAPIKDIKASLVKYGEAFEKTGSSLLHGDELYYKAITP